MAESHERRGKLTGDPAKSLPIGGGFTFNAKTFTPTIATGAGALVDWDYFGSALLALAFGTARRMEVSGSAVLIAPGLALAARHVLDPVHDRLMAGLIEGHAWSILKDRLLLWRLRELSLGDTDVALLRLDLATDFPKDGLSLATLTTRTPLLGEPILIAGIRAPKAAKSGKPVGVEVRIGVGEVAAVYQTGRDRVLMPHPAVEVRCLTLGGMSGGPAFDKNGNLLGILSTSIKHEEGPSNVSLWRPVVANEIQSMWPLGIAPVPTNILELAKRGLIAIDRPEALRIVPSAPGVQTTQYAPWS